MQERNKKAPKNALHTRMFFGAFGLILPAPRQGVSALHPDAWGSSLQALSFKCRCDGHGKAGGHGAFANETGRNGFHFRGSLRFKVAVEFGDASCSCIARTEIGTILNALNYDASAGGAVQHGDAALIYSNGDTYMPDAISATGTGKED